MSSHNSRCPGVKRLLREAQELHDATEEYFAQPLEDNLFEWHFTVRGPPETDFEGGIYHGRVVLPPEYPMKPPSIIFLTGNGRFEINKKICLSISGHHPEMWQPSWSIRTALLAIIGFMPTPAHGTLGGIDYTPSERKILARKSHNYVCHDCGPVHSLLKARTGTNTEIQAEAKQASSQIMVGKSESSHNLEKSTDKESYSQDSSSQDRIQPSSNPEESGDKSSANSNVSDSTSESSTNLANSPSHRQRTVSTSSFPNDFILSAAVLLLIVLILRRLFLMEPGSFEEMDDILI